MPSRPAPLACAPALLVLGVALASLSGCSAVTNIPQESCTENQQCRDGFGLGWVCDTGSGLCQEAESNSLCKDVYPSDLLTNSDKYPGDTILFATLLDGMGDIQMIRSANLAIEQVKNNGLEGRAFGVINCSYGTDSDVERQLDDAVEASRHVVDKYGVVAIIGPGTSSIAEAIYNEVKDEVLIISPSATSDSLTFIDGMNKSFDTPGLFWRTAPPDSGIARRMADELVNSGRVKPALIFKDGAYGNNLADLLTKSLQEQGLILEKFAYTDSSTDLGVAMNNVGNLQGVDEIVFIADSNPDVVTFLTDAATRSMNVNSSFATASLMLGDAGFSETNVLALLPPAVTTAFVDTNKIRGVKPKSPSLSDPAFSAFSTAYSGAYPGDSPANAGYTAESYDATWLAIYGSAWALYNEDGITPRGMAKGLHRISNGNPFDINATSWNTIRSAFEAGVGVNITGASGNLDFDDASEETAGIGELWIIVDMGGVLSYMILG
ncbi:MAG: ABC transporter substrate-binding protein [Nannocystaceae bacterium]